MNFKAHSQFLIFTISILALIVLSSCASRQDLVYFQDEPINSDQLNSAPKQLVYKPDDILTINVSAADALAAQPFNLGLVASSTDLLNAGGAATTQTYLIDYNGNIEFPVLGTINLEGMTRIEATAMLKEKISEYAKDPIVNIRLVNFTVTIIGEVTRPGTFTIQDERITLPEALGMANDLTIYGKRKDILLIREVEGVKKFAKIDLTSVNAVMSPLYYLQQNDVIVVEPNDAKVRSSAYNPNNGLLISAIGTAATIVAIILANK